MSRSRASRSLEARSSRRSRCFASSAAIRASKAAAAARSASRRSSRARSSRVRMARSPRETPRDSRATDSPELDGETAAAFEPGDGAGDALPERTARTRLPKGEAVAAGDPGAITGGGRLLDDTCEHILEECSRAGEFAIRAGRYAPSDADRGPWGEGGEPDREEAAGRVRAAPGDRAAETVDVREGDFKPRCDACCD
eukprot:scaffold95681_cov31-Tisochrysis_lutea.AAC.5